MILAWASPFKKKRDLFNLKSMFSLNLKSPHIWTRHNKIKLHHLLGYM